MISFKNKIKMAKISDQYKNSNLQVQLIRNKKQNP